MILSLVKLQKSPQDFVMKGRSSHTQVWFHGAKKEESPKNQLHKEEKTGTTKNLW